MKDKKFTHLKTRDEFIKRATDKHDGKYTYDNVVFPPREPRREPPSARYPNGRVRRLPDYDSEAYIFITCPKHGDFKQRARKHLEGVGCKYCALEVRSNALIGRNKLANFKEGHDYIDDGTTITINCIPSHKQLRQIVIDKEDEEILEYCTWRTTGHQKSRHSRTEYAVGQKTNRIEHEGLGHLGSHPKIHRLIMERALGRKLKKKEYIDHIDGNGLNNRRSNLRVATQSQNSANQGKINGNFSSKYKGVCWDKSKQNWMSYIGSTYGSAGKSIKTKREYLGRFKNEEDAARAYDKRARELWGDYAHLNFPIN